MEKNISFKIYQIIAIISTLTIILECSIINEITDFDLCDNSRCQHGSCTRQTVIMYNNKLEQIKTCECDPGWEGEYCHTCNGRVTFTDKSGTISDGSGNYTLNTKCSWLLLGDRSQLIRIRLKQLSTECGWDHLYIYDGDSISDPLVAVFSGASITNKPIELVLHSGRAFIHFYSDAAYNMSGFRLTYKMGNHTCPFDCNDRGVCSMGVCECIQGWKGTSCQVAAACNCQPHGRCVQSECICDIGFQGVNCTVPSSTALWTTSEGLVTLPKLSSHSAVILSTDVLWLFGGYNFDSNPSFHTYKVNLITKNATRYTSSLIPRYGLSVVHYKNTFYIFGGRLQNGSISDELWTFTPGETPAWVQIITQGHTPYAVTGHTADIVKDCMYVIFGHSKKFGYSMFVQSFNFTTQQWRLLKPAGAVVKGGFEHSSVTHAGDIYIHGGYHFLTLKAIYLSDRLIRYRPATNEWYILRGSGEYKYLHAATALHGNMYVYGGNTHNQTQTNQTPSHCHSTSLLVYNFDCDTWRPISYSTESGVLLSRYGHVMQATLSGQHLQQLVVHGGFDGRILSSAVTLQLPRCGALPRQQCSYSDDCSWSDGNCTRRGEGTGENSCSTSGVKTQLERRIHCEQLKYCNSCMLTSYRCHYCNSVCSANQCEENPSRSKCDAKSTTALCNNIDNCNMCALYNSTCNYNKYACQDNNQQNLSSKLQTNQQPPAAVVAPQCLRDCSVYSTCEQCTNAIVKGTSSPGCMWCQSRRQCIDQNAYVAEFVYGECRQWATLSSVCQDLSCESKETCLDCQKLPECGWCNAPQNNGLGKCVNGSLTAPKSCEADKWFYKDCPTCQCNGHSNCTNNTSQCTQCAPNYTGIHCEYCRDGYYGDALNGGNCTECNCGKKADFCNKSDGKCYCNTRGVAGSKCNVCKHDYFGNIHKGGTCYYKLITDFQFTFNLSAQEDLHITHLNFANFPTKRDRDIDFTVNCSGHATINVTVTSRSRPHENFVLKNFNCQYITTKMSHKLYDFTRKENTTFFIYVFDFKTPFTIMISFSQFPEIDLIHFFITFFSCFLSLLILALIFWKLKQKYDAYRLRQRRKVVQKQRASRPTAFFDLDLGCPSSAESPMSTKSTDKISYIATEPLEKGRYAIATVIISLPCDGGHHRSNHHSNVTHVQSLCIASTLVMYDSQHNNNILKRTSIIKY